MKTDNDNNNVNRFFKASVKLRVQRPKKKIKEIAFAYGEKKECKSICKIRA